MPLEPSTPEELAEALAEAAAARRTISLGGHFSKRAMGGPVAPADVSIGTGALTRVLKYEPADLTLSVQAGAPWADLSRLLAESRQMIPLDPPFPGRATVGGVIATNASGPRRRLYGTARDLVIGMQFATLGGKLVQSGGMVVKNVAGLDTGKLMIGSFGTLAAIAVVNFKLTPTPEQEQTSLREFATLEAAIDARDTLIRGVLQPSAVDLLNPALSAETGAQRHLLAVRFGGNAAVVARYARELGGAILHGDAQERFWNTVIRFSEHHADRFMGSTVVRISSTLTQIPAVLASLPPDTPALSRAASGVTYAYFSRTRAASDWISSAKPNPWRCAIEMAPLAEKSSLDQWPSPGDDFEMMKNVKRMFDPGNLLNHGRLYGRI